ncbi:cache domain-containing sensor histidine kinase [Paenibacillus lentus]|uniref:Sensor histidine kinase n=1 Tax=Paenibacillus lentus TaxID=1338368 RepID=A0A3Q8S4Y3_9BACL|nr:sensor histidine kinase [Paenibacillus lentus]AZK46769.1 sensor histidine kinase [Paenibacillus lentus]
MTRLRRGIQWLRNLKLAQKWILINSVLIVIPLGALGIYAFSSFRGTLETNVGESQLQTMKQITLNIDTYMEELNRLSLMPYQYQDILDYLASERKPGASLSLEEISLLNNFVSKVFLNGRIDIMGVSLYGSKGASYVVMPESQYVTTYRLDEDAEWIKEAQGQFGELIFLTTHELKPTSGSVYEVFSIVRELRSFDSGKSLGYIVLDVDPAVVGQILAQVQLGRRESLYITNARGDLVIRKGSAVPEVDGAVIPFSGEGVTHLEANGERLLVSYATSELTQWTTVGAVPVSELMQDSLQVRNSITIMGIICVGLAMLFSVFTAYRITLPIRKLSRLMKKVEKGQLEVDFPVNQWDEVGQLGSAFNRMVSRLSELGYLLYETEIREKDAQIAALQSKINPHFLYNTLGSISMYAELEGSKEITTMTNNLSRILRYSLNAHQSGVVLKDEIEHIRSYMAIQKLRYDERLHFTLDIAAEAMDCAVIPLMIQPIVENSFKHGLDKGIGEGRISLTGGIQDGLLLLTVEDDGIGLTTAQLEHLRRQLAYSRDLGGETGNGLLNVHRRLVLCYGERYGLTIDSMPYQGVRVTLTIPAKHMSKDEKNHAPTVFHSTS